MSDTEAGLLDELATDPFQADLMAELAAARRRRYANRATAVLGGLVLLAGGFLAGAQVQKHYGETPTAASPTSNPFAGFSGGAGGGQRNFGGSSPASAAPATTTGTVKLVDGTTIYIQTAAGEVITVRTTTGTSVSTVSKLSDLKAGATVSVEGPAASDGTVTATRITKTR